MTRPLDRRARVALVAVVAATMSVAAACTPGPEEPAGPCDSDSVPSISAGYPLTVPAPGWYAADTRANGSSQVDGGLPKLEGFGCTSARFTTGETDGGKDKAQLVTFSYAGSPLDDIEDISYWSFRSSASTSTSPAPTTALNVGIHQAGSTAVTYLVYEPYLQSGGNDGVVPDVWQFWDATTTAPGDGRWWSNAVGQGTYFSWDQLQGLYPGATIRSIGFNVGSYNPNLLVGGEGLTIDGVTTDF